MYVERTSKHSSYELPVPYRYRTTAKFVDSRNKNAIKPSESTSNVHKHADTKSSSPSSNEEHTLKSQAKHHGTPQNVSIRRKEERKRHEQMIRYLGEDGSLEASEQNGETPANNLTPKIPPVTNKNAEAGLRHELNVLKLLRRKVSRARCTVGCGITTSVSMTHLHVACYYWTLHLQHYWESRRCIRPSSSDVPISICWRIVRLQPALRNERKQCLLMFLRLLCVPKSN